MGGLLRGGCGLLDAASGPVSPRAVPSLSLIHIFNSVINFIVIIVFNKISKRVSEVRLW